MKVVMVSQRVDRYPNRKEKRDALDQRLINFLFLAGYLPVPVPNRIDMSSPDSCCVQEPLFTWLDALKPNAIVLSGGNDIGQCRERDSTEGLLLDYARRYEMPLLGICRGMQMMAYWAGVTLHPVQGHVQTRHRLMGDITGEVNSYHSFSLTTCPVDFEVLSRSEDGEIEAIRHRTLPWEGWMWHPEREENFAVQDMQRIQELFSV